MHLAFEVNISKEMKKNYCKNYKKKFNMLQFSAFL